MKIEQPKSNAKHRTPQKPQRWMFDVRYSMCRLLTLAFIASGNPLFAEKFVLTDAIVHTVSGETLSPGMVSIDGDKITEVGKSVRVAGSVVSLKGLHLYPGLIALDTALGLSEISGVRSTRDIVESGDFTPEVESWIAVNPDSELLPVARANGVTHIEPAPQGGVVAGRSGLVALSGWTTEQMAVHKPAALHVYWPSMNLDVRPKDKFKDKTKWKSLEDQAKQRQTKLRALQEFFEEALAYDKAVSASNTHHAPELVPAWEAVRPYVRGEKPIFVHADDIRQIKAALAWANKSKLKIVLVGAQDAALVADKIAAQTIPVIYEHIFTQPSHDTMRYDVHYHTPEILRASGIKLALGMGATTFDAGLVKNLPYTVAQAIAYGLPEGDALKSITLVPAQLIGAADRLGSIEAEKEATLFASDGNIFDIRANVKRVWIRGKEIPLETRHTRLYEKYKNRPRPQ